MRLLLRNQENRKKFRTRIAAAFVAFMVLFSMLGSDVLTLTTHAAEEGLFDEGVAEEAPAPVVEEVAEVPVEEPVAEPEAIAPAAEPEVPAQPEAPTPEEIPQPVETPEVPEQIAPVEEAQPEATDEADMQDDEDTEDEEEEPLEEETEEIKMPAGSASGHAGNGVNVNASWGEGVFPESVTMVVRSASEAQVKAYAERITSDDVEVVDVIAVDISFYVDGAEVQPADANSVQVSIAAPRVVEGDYHEVIHVEDGGGAEIISGASAQSASFTGDSFSIYGIIGVQYADDDVETHARVFYEFYRSVGDATPIETQIVRDGEALVVPAEPGGDGKNVFKGWFTIDEGGAWSEQVTSVDHISIAPTDPVAEEEAQDQTVRAYARFDELYKVTFYTDEAKSAVYRSVLAADGETVDVRGTTLADKNDESRFRGWKTADKEAIVESVAIDGADVELLPAYISGYNVYFDTMSADAETVEAVWTPDGESVKDALADVGRAIPEPTRDGYRFDGWYASYRMERDASGRAQFDDADAFDFSAEITEPTTLYAKWTQTEAIYVVRVWLENADDDGYTLSETQEKTGAADEPINIGELTGEFTKDKYTGFHINGTTAKPNNVNYADDGNAFIISSGGKTVEYDVKANKWVGNAADAIVSGDGSTTVDVYYSRDAYQIIFRFDGSISAAGNSMKVEGITVGTKLNPTYYDQTKEAVGYADVFDTATVIKYGQNMYQRLYLNLSKIQAFMDAGQSGVGGWSFWATWLQDSPSKNTWQTVFDASNSQLAFNPGGRPDGSEVMCVIRNNVKQYEYTIVHHYADAYGRLDGSFDRDDVEKEIDGVTYTFDKETTSSTRYDEWHTQRFTIGQVKDGFRLVAVDGYYQEGGKNDQNRDQTTKLIRENAQTGETEYQYYFNGTKAEGFDAIHVYWVPVQYALTYVQAKDAEIAISDTDSREPVTYAGIHAGANTGDYAAPEWNLLHDKNGVKYAFSGWTPEVPDTMPAADVTVFGTWIPENFRVTFDPDNGNETLAIDVPAYRLAQQYETIDGAKELVKTGYVFKGWIDADGDWFDFNERIIRNYDLKAVWESGEPYTVKYDAGEDGAFDYEADPDKYVAGAQAPILGQATPKEASTVFVGWKIGGKGALLKTGSFTISAENDLADGEEDHTITLVAQYERREITTSVVYHSNYPEGPVDAEWTEKAVYVNGNFNIAYDAEDLGFAPEGGYRFVGWTNTAAEKIYSASEAIEYFYKDETVAAGASDNHLYAVWTLIEEERVPAAPTIPEEETPDDPETPPVGGGEPTPAMPEATDPDSNPAATTPDMPQAGAPAVLGALRRTDAESTVFGARRAKTGETRDYGSFMTLMFGSLALTALLAGEKRKQK